MKYKQRLLVVSITTVLCLILMAFNMSRNKNVKEISQTSGKCTTGTYVTSDWMIDEIYDVMNFTVNSRVSGGLYSLHERNDNFTKSGKHGKEFLEIIVVPHSHNDPGWLRTLDEYYIENVQNILHNTVLFLNTHPDFRMIWTEIVFLDMWWENSSDAIKKQFRDHVKSGRIEILSGGWVSVDEATTHYSAVLDQLIEGHLWVKEVLGVHPNISWSIDPFGYSTSLPYLWFKSGMKDMTILRIHGAVKQFMAHRHLLTFKWRQFWDSRGNNDIFCHVEPYKLYNIEHSCGPDLDICLALDFGLGPRLPSTDHASIFYGYEQAENLHEFATIVAAQYRKKADNYKNNVLLVPHGDDNRYRSIKEFENVYDDMKRLMNHINSRPDLNIRMKFGTVGDYFNLLHKSIKKPGHEHASISGDFFTYTDSDNDYWSGYFTTRPFDKRMIRYLLELLKTAEIFTSYALFRAKQAGYLFPHMKHVIKHLQEARRTHGLVQHHDAITGTSAHLTVIDFENRIASSIQSLQSVISIDLESLLLRQKAKVKVAVRPVHVQKRSDSPIDKRVINVSKTGTQVIFTNSYSQRRKELVNLVVNTHKVKVFDQKNKEVEVQLNPCWVTQNEISDSKYEIVFLVELPQMGLVTYTIKKAKAKVTYAKITTYNGAILPSLDIFKSKEEMTKHSAFKLYTPKLSVHFSTKNGLLQKICKGDWYDKCQDIKVDWHWYKGVNSNAYCYGADGRSSDAFTKPTLVRVVSGHLSSTVIVTHELLEQRVTIYNSPEIHGTYVYVENVVTLSYEDYHKELFMRLRTSIRNSNMQYFTDSNSFQLVSRQTRKNYPMGANIFPVTSMAVMEDQHYRLTIHAAQSLGVGSFKQGSLDFLIDRVPMGHGKGLQEAVMDNKPTLGKFIIQLEEFAAGGSPSSTAHRKRITQPSVNSLFINDFLQSPLLSFVSSRQKPYDVTELSVFKSSLPCSLVVANMKTFISEKLRLEGTGVTFHKRQSSCQIANHNGLCREDVKVDLFNLFNDLHVLDVRKMSLTHLNVKEHFIKSSVVEIEPMELESFSYRWR